MKFWVITNYENFWDKGYYNTCGSLTKHYILLYIQKMPYDIRLMNNLKRCINRWIRYNQTAPMFVVKKFLEEEI